MTDFSEFAYLLEKLGREIATLARRVKKAEAVKESLISALRTAEESSVVDSTPAKQLEGMTKLDKALQNIAIAKRILVENSCPSEFGLKDCEYNPGTGCSLCCEDCWNQEVE